MMGNLLNLYADTACMQADQGRWPNGFEDGLDESTRLAGRCAMQLLHSCQHCRLQSCDTCGCATMHVRALRENMPVQINRGTNTQPTISMQKRPAVRICRQLSVTITVAGMRLVCVLPAPPNCPVLMACQQALQHIMQTTPAHEQPHIAQSACT